MNSGKIFIVCDRLSEMGGVQRVVRTISDAFADRGRSVELVTVSSRAVPENIAQRHVLKEHVLFSKRWWWQLLRRIEIGRVHFRGMRIERLAFLQKRRARHFLARLADDNPGSVFLFVDLYAAQLGVGVLSGRAATIVQYHNSFDHLSKDAFFDAARQISARVDRFVALTETDATQFRNAGFHSVDWVSNPVPFYPDAVSDVAQRPLRAVAIGRFTQQKGFDVLLRAWRRVQSRKPDWSLEIYGGGTFEETARLEALAEEAGVTGSVRFAGFVSDVRQRLEDSRFYVLPSRYEGLPMVLLEAMSCGTVCIGTDCSPGVRMLLNSVGSPTVPVEDEEEFASALMALMDDETRCRAIAAKGRDYAFTFAPAAIVDRWLDIFSQFPSGQVAAVPLCSDLAPNP